MSSDPKFEKLLRDIETATARQSPDAMAAKPSGEWSADEIIEHLILAARVAGAAARRAKAPPEGAQPPPGPPFTLRMARLLVLGMGVFPGRRKAPDFVSPKPRVAGDTAGDEPARAVARLREAMVTLDTALADAALRLGPKTPVMEHPVLGPFSADDWRRFTIVHTRLHIRQMRRRLSGRR